jgi:O-antigen/teichoic acid export membrane protein
MSEIPPPYQTGFPTPQREGVVRNVTALGIGNVAVKPLWFAFITYFCISVLPVEAYGRLNWALWLMLIAASFTDLGTSHYTTRAIARDLAVASELFSNFLVFRLVVGLGIVSLVIVGGLASDFASTRLMAACLAAVYAIAFYGLEFCRVVFRAYEVLRFEAWSLILEKILVVSGGMTGLYAYRSAEGTLAGMALGMAVTLLIVFSGIHAHFIRFRWAAVRSAVLWRHLRNAIPLGVFGILIGVYVRMGPLVLEWFHGEAAVGQFGAAFRVVEALFLLPALISAALLPRLSRTHSLDHAAFVRLTHQALAFVGAISLVVSVGLTAAGDPIMDVIVANQSSASYAESGTLLSLLGPAYPAMCLNVIMSAVLVAANEQRYLARFMAWATLFTLVLYVSLVAPLGARGVCYVLFLSELVVTAAFYVRFRMTGRRHAE